MRTMVKLMGAALLLVGCLAPVWAQQTASERASLSRYLRYAGAPVDHVTYFQVDGFQYLAPATVAIWFGVNKLYLLTVQTPCINLAFADGIALTAKNNVLHRDFDAITFGQQRCKILKIVPVDELKMKQDAAKAKQAVAPASSG